MSFEIRTYGDEALRRKAVPVKDVDEDIRRLAREMLETMYASDGVGLAAEQVGRSEAVCVIDIPKRAGQDEGNPEMPLVLINPVITDESGEQTGQEGCLSFPGVSVNIKRAMRVTVSFTGEDGNQRSVEANGLLARAIQHEVDHLNGVLLVDRMSWTEKLTVSGQLKRLKQETLAHAS